MRRRVLFVHGFDPRGPRHYLSLFKRHARQWAAREGVGVTFGPRPPRERHLVAQPIAVTETDVHCSLELLRWDDHVRARWPRGWRLAPAFLRAAWRLARSGSFARLWRRARPAALSAVVWPAIWFVNDLLCVLLAAAGVALALVHPAWLLLPLPSLALAVAIRRRVGPEAIRWTAAGIVHEAGSERADPLAPERRAALAEHLGGALRDGTCDEVVVVSHSLGARVAISMVADALRREPAVPPRLLMPRLLTLGHSTTVLAAMAGAGWFREDLAVLAAGGVDWVDVTSPLDGINVALADPARESGLARGARTFNAWFRETLSPARYAAARADPYDLHFLFLGVSDRPDPAELDLLDMILSPAPALARYDRPEEPGPFYAPERVAERRAAAMSAAEPSGSVETKADQSRST